MAKLEIRHPDGRVETRPLSRRQPVAFGRHPASDVRLDGPGVEPLHGRLSWNGRQYEVTAASPAGIEVNGTLVGRKELESGDVIRVGDVDLVLIRTKPERPSRDDPAARQVTQEFSIADLAALDADEDAPPVPPSPFRPVGRTPSRPPSPVAADDAVEFAEEFEPTENAELIDEAEEIPVLLDVPPPAATVVAPAAAPPRAAARPVPSRGLFGRAKRPGEQDLLGSPLVLGFGGLAAALLLAAGVVWLLIGREGADRLYAAAVADREAGRYSQAVPAFERFLTDYPSDGRAAGAKFALGAARVERHTTGAAPEWTKAVGEFNAFVRANRDAPDFAARRPELRALARTLAAGAAGTAERTGDRSVLEVAAAGRTLFDRYAAGDATTDAVRAQLAAAYEKADAAVRRKEYADAAMTTIETAVAAKDFPAAFAARENLLTRYPELRSQKRLAGLLARTLTAERELVRVIPEDDPASRVRQPAGSASPAQLNPRADALGSPLIPVGRTQAQAGEVPDGRVVFAVARGSLFGLDAVTGRPLWRRAIGTAPPFFPIETDSPPGVLTVDAARGELLLLRREDGSPVWRTPLAAAAIGEPLVGPGRIDLPTADRRLARFDLETGRPIVAAEFPQALVGPPVLLAGADRLIVFGVQATAYTLDARSLAPLGVSYIGHRAGAIGSPPFAAGRLVLTIENDRLDASLLRAFEFDAETLRPVDADRIDGRVSTRPALRGNQLFVGSSPERITAFSVSDAAGQPPLTRLAAAELPDPQDVPLSLVAGPDGQVWAAGSALRKLTIEAGGWTIDPKTLAPGRHTQPPQVSGESLFVARSLPYSRAVFVSQADAETMTGSWRTVLGGSVLAVASKGDDAVAVTDAGQVLSFSPANLAAGGFRESTPLPDLDEAAAAPLHATTLDGRIVVWRSGPNALLWSVDPSIRVGRPRRLEAGPQCSPAVIEAGLVLPLPGRLELSGQAAEPFLLPITGDAAAPEWRFLAGIDSSRFAALDATGTLRVIAFRTTPSPHLAEVVAASVDPQARLAAAGGRLAVAAGRKLSLLDPAGLRPIGEVDLGGPATAGPWTVGETLAVEVGGQRIETFDATALGRGWKLDLGDAAAGPPLRSEEEWFVASQSGRVRRLGEDGKVRETIDVGEPLTGLFAVAGRVVAAGLDGALFSLPGGPVR